MADAQGGFVTRAFEKLLKDSAGRRYPKLQQSLKAYLDRPKDHVFRNIVIDDETLAPGISATAVVSGSLADAANGSESAPIQDDVVLDTQATSVKVEEHGQLETGLFVPGSQSAANVAAAATMAEAGHSLEGSEVEIVMQPLQLAIETKQSKLIETALDTIHKLIAYGHLKGEAGLERGKSGPLASDLFHLVCSCADNTAIDSVVLQVIKVLLTAVASSTFQVHGDCLVLAIRTCYNIVLNSKKPVNLNTAKATLTQMISIVFKRMELTVNEGAAIMSTTDVTPAGDDEGAKRTANGDSDPVHKDGAEERAEEEAVSVEQIQTLAGESDIKGLEAALDKAVRPDGGADDATQGVDLQALTTGQSDALLVFRTLCKMAMKEGTDDLIVRTKILSLELLQGLLESVSHAFTMNFAFIDSIKMYLCYALVRACVSANDRVFHLACSLFSVLILRYRESLKAEIGLFFPLVVLRSLDSPDCPVSQRQTVLAMLEGITSQPQMLADIFVNYDCDLEATNLLERLLNSLSRIAQGSPTSDPASIVLAQTTSLKVASLQCLVNVLQSLVGWAQKDAPPRKEAFQAEDETLPSSGTSESSQASQFGKAKAHKSIMEASVAEFNMKPEKGIAFLEAHGVLKREPHALANFLRTTAGLNKTLVGDYLGQHGDFHVSVMHAYVDSMSFKGLSFDAAIRTFLNGFRLPGEAQKIDRIMEKFAERYCRDNPGLFKTADTAYVLAYAVIMLNTDAHNPVVVSKMSKADFVRINSGSDGEEPAPVAMLEDIYESIVRDEIKLKDDTLKGARSSDEKGRILGVLNLAAPRQRNTAQTREESEDIIRRTKALFRNGGVKRGVFHTAQHAELAQPMLEVVGWPLLAAFSVTMEDGDLRNRSNLCMTGFRLGIHLSKLLSMETMRYAYLTSLIRFTFLHAPKEMRTKNVEALRALLHLAEREPDALQDTWNAILECLSRLEHITSSPALAASVMAMNNQVSRDALLATLQELGRRPLEQVFLNSAELPSDAIVEFFTALCGVSAEELRSVPPRVFSLQKLVEISYYNISPRIRLVWARIWAVLSLHFVAAGGHPDLKVAMYAIDSLRQLAIKYLEREELENFTFQNDIMKPFVVIMRTSKVASIRELIVQCIVQMIQSRVSSIKSGWRSVFMVLTTAAFDSVEAIVDNAFENVEQVVLEHFDQVVGDCFMDCVNCLIAFANNKVSPRISLKAIALLRICEDRLAEGRIPGGTHRPVDEGVAGDLVVTEYYWFPMLAGLSDLTSDPRTEVRNCALEVLFDLLKERGSAFSHSFWASVFERVLFPIFDYVRHAGSNGQQPSSADIWLRETSIHSLHLLCDLFCTFYQAVSFMLPSLLGLLLDCATRPDQGLAAIAIAALLQLMDMGSTLFGASEWTVLLDSLRVASLSTQPLELLDKPDPLKAATQPSVDLAPPSHGLDAPSSPSEEIGGISSAVAGDKDEDKEEAYSQEGSSLTPRSAQEATYSPPQAMEDPMSPVAAKEQGFLYGLSSSRSIGQKLMGSMMDTLLMKNISAKARGRQSDAPIYTPSSQVDEPDEEGLVAQKDEEVAGGASESLRVKCYVQLLLLSAFDRLQAKHWMHLKASHKRQLLDSVQAMVDFAAAYDSYPNLELRMLHLPADRPPPNLLRQEIAGTQIYIIALLRALGDPAAATLNSPLDTGLVPLPVTDSKGPPKAEEEQRDDTEEVQLQQEAEARLLALCQRVLGEAANLQSVQGHPVEASLHSSLQLRAPVVSQILRALVALNEPTFGRFVGSLYPHCTRLICSDQMEVRQALGDLFKFRITTMLPTYTS